MNLVILIITTQSLVLLFLKVFKTLFQGDTPPHLPLPSTITKFGDESFITPAGDTEGRVHFNPYILQGLVLFFASLTYFSCDCLLVA